MAQRVDHASVRVGGARLGIASVVLAMAVLVAGCGANSASGTDHQLDAVAERLVETVLPLKYPEAAGGPAPAAGGPQAGSNLKIGNTGGTGVSTRSDCLDSARNGGSWADDVVVAVAETGTGRCAGWIRGTSAGVTSWVRSEYLVSGGTSTPAAAAATPVAAAGDIRQQVASLRETAWRIALLMRATPGSGNGTMAPTYLGMAATNAKDLATQAQAAGGGAGDCAPARARLVSAARELETLATTAKSFFEAPGPEGVTATRTASESYMRSQAALATAINACVAG